MRILLTRTAENNERTKKKLAAMGHTAISLPLAHLSDLGTVISDNCDGYIITSTASLDIILNRNTGFDKRLPIYCVGQRTSESATNIGCENIAIQAENALELSQKLIDHFKVRSVNLIYVAGKQRAHEFSNSIGDGNINITLNELYSVERLNPDISRFIQAMEMTKNGVQLHFSTLSALHFFELVKKYELQELSQTMHSLSISQKTAEAVDISLVKSAQNAKIATEASLLWQVELMINKSPDKR